MQNTKQQPIQRPISQYIGKQRSLLDETLTYIQGTLPQPFSKLQSNLNNIPHYIMNQNLYKQIHTFNKSLIIDQFEFICELVLQLYRHEIQNMNKLDFGKFLSEINKQINENINGGSYLIKRLMDSMQNYNYRQNQIQVVKYILANLGISHYKMYEYNNKEKNVTSLNNLFYHSQKDKLPQKYRKIIENKLSLIQKPANNNYFEDLILNNITNLVPGQMDQKQLQAQTNASFLNQLFKQKHKVQSNQITKKQRLFKPTNSTINFFPFAVTTGTNQQKPLNQNQEIIINNNNFLSVPNQQHSQKNQMQYNQKMNQIVQMSKDISKQQKIQLQNWFTNTFSQMTYYESYMMAHMADLILLHPHKFQTKCLNYQPYLHQLNKHLQQQLNNLLSQQAVFCLLYNSKYKNYPQSNLLSSSKDYQKPQYKQGNTKIIDKAAKIFQGLYRKARQLSTNQPQKTKQLCIENNSTNNKLLEENKNVVISRNLYETNKQYDNTLRGLQKLKSYISQIQQSQKMSSDSMFDSIKYFAVQIKKKFVNDQQQYHCIQSWMAIVIILYKQIGFDQSNNYHYTPLKRRIIIKICKNIFRQENKNENNKKNKKKDNKKLNDENPFKNWPVVLKFLQNNRPQILQDPQSKTNQKAVDQILQQLYSAILQKQMQGSTFNNLFQGIQNIKQNLPHIKLICLSNGSNTKQNLNKSKTTTQCKIVHILISGFLSQDTNKLQEWSDMVDLMSDSQIYALVWQSNTIKNLVKFFLKSAVDIIGAIKMADQLRKKYTDNPFNPAFQVAQITGRILAQFVIRIFPNRFVNVCGYSLGSEVIKEFLRRMINKKQSHLVNNVYLMGGVSDAPSFAEIISHSYSPLSVYNCYTNNDSVLRHLLSLCKPDIKPIGLNEIKKVEGHSVVNMNCTKFISGHLAFRSNLSLMGQFLELSTG